jgi:hypothetical protein
MRSRPKKAPGAGELTGRKLVATLDYSALALLASSTAEGGSKKGHSYKPLPKRFRHDGFDYRQIAREKAAAIYEQTRQGCPNCCAYEVIRIRRREGFQIGQRFIEPAEVHPNSEACGVDGWTLTDKESAFRKLREINARARRGGK